MARTNKEHIVDKLGCLKCIMYGTICVVVVTSSVFRWFVFDLVQMQSFRWIYFFWLMVYMNLCYIWLVHTLWNYVGYYKTNIYLFLCSCRVVSLFYLSFQVRPMYLGHCFTELGLCQNRIKLTNAMNSRLVLGCRYEFLFNKSICNEWHVFSWRTPKDWVVRKSKSAMCWQQVFWIYFCRWTTMLWECICGKLKETTPLSLETSIEMSSNYEVGGAWTETSSSLAKDLIRLHM